MDKVYVIKDERHCWGCVARKEDVVPFVILKEILLLCDSGDGEYTIMDYLGMSEEASKQEVCAVFESLAYPLQKLILEHFCITIEEMEVWKPLK